MSVKIGQIAPDFEVDAVVGSGDFKKIRLSEFTGKWVALFFYPLDFTFVCPTEIREFNSRHDDFLKRNAVVIGGSTDSKFSHKAWIEKDLGPLKFPLIADFTKKVASEYGILREEMGVANRGVFLIDPDQKIRYMVVHDLGVGRSVDEVLRVLSALQTGANCPAEWKPGQKTL